MFYEARVAIAFIRSPMGHSGEGRTRPRTEDELPEVSAALDRAYVVVERFKQYETLFSGLKAKKYRFMAVFRGNAHEPFDEIDGVLNTVFVSNNLLNEYYWNSGVERPRDTERYSEYLAEMHQHKQNIWGGLPDDPVAPRVEAAVRKVETIADEAARGYMLEHRPWLPLRG
jgi:hypothetical protein